MIRTLREKKHLFRHEYDRNGSIQIYRSRRGSMAEIYETKKLTERVILVGVAFQEGDDTVQSLEELGELAATAGALTCLLYTSPSPRDRQKSRMPSSA